MSEIKKITCGKLPCVLPNGRKVEPDYYELTVNTGGAELVHYYNDTENRHEVNDEVLLETALEKVGELIESNPDEQPYAENIPLSKAVTFDDGTVKYAPSDELMQILVNLMIFNRPEFLQPQGLVQAPAAPQAGMPVMGLMDTFIGMGSINGELPALQGMIPAAKPENKPAGCTEWTCKVCGAVSGGKFCAECGSPKPEEE